MVKEKRLITAALPYTNNVPHIGNIVGSHLPADIFARFCRLMGYDTVFVGGTDEHGTASEIAALKLGITPKRLCNFFYKVHKKIYDWFNISYDNFSQTSREIHHKTTQEFMKKVYENGYIFEKTLELPYCMNCNKQLADRYIEGICPFCGYDRAKGDQCENCSRLLEPIKLKSPKCVICGSTNIKFEKVKHLFFDLKKLEPRLKKWIQNNKHWRQQVRKLALAWIKEGLKPRCITRDLKWGVKVPFKNYEHLVFYVWVDAPIGYISSTKEWNIKKWKDYWQNKETKIYHFIGKDNIPFHTIFFPGMLMANGEYNLPYNVVGLQYLNYEGSKFSKSQNHGVFCENLPDTELDADYWRFYLALIIPELKDTEFFWQEFKNKINSELVGNLGNFINRTLSFIQNKFNNRIPEPKLTVKDKTFVKKVETEIKNYVKEMENVELRNGLQTVLKLSAMGNKYFQDNEPWKDLERAKTILYVCANLCDVLSKLISPYLPNSAQKLSKMLNSSLKWKDATLLNLQNNHKINQVKILFNKIENETVTKLKEKTSKVTEFFKPKPKKEVHTKMKEEPAKVQLLKTFDHYVPMNEFKKLDLRVGKIVKIKEHPNADKLYIMLVDLGFGENDRQIVAGLKPYYKIEELIGKKVVIVTNLQPALIRGIESNGMLLAAVDNDKVSLLTTDKDVKAGAEIK